MHFLADLDLDISFIDLDFQNPLSANLSIDIGLDYELNKICKASPTIAVAPILRLCTVCSVELPVNTSHRIFTCGPTCSKINRREQVKRKRSRRFKYDCVNCKGAFEVSYSMWDEVRSRGLLCAKCHTASAETRLGEEGPDEITKEPPCSNCRHGYAEPSSYIGVACRSNARTCAPNVYSRLFQPRF